MRIRRSWSWAVPVVALVVLTASARADEEKIPLDKLPKAVVDAVKAKFPGAELVSAEKEKENGEIVYEVAIKYKDQKIEVTCKEDGSIVSIEKEISVKDLPKEVAEALEAKYPKAEIKKVEEVMENGMTNYEVLLVTADKKKLEVTFDAKGKVLEEEKKEEKKDK
jgi:uncharacterized membrane protein YkoI